MRIIKQSQPSTFELLRAVHDALAVSLNRQQLGMAGLERLPLSEEIAHYAAIAQRVRDDAAATRIHRF